MPTSIRSISRFLFQIFLSLNLLGIAHAAGDLDATMQAMSAGILSNYTPGSAYHSQSMGVISGPSFYARNKVANVRLYNLTAPSVKASCSGIDAWGGAFSFISATELVSFVRKIAANAVPYAFNIALSTLCKDCNHHMQVLADQANKFNLSNKSSCEYAKQLVEGTNLRTALEGFMSNTAAEKGVTADYQEARFGRNSISTEVAEKMPAVALEFEGNVGWTVLNQADIPDWFGTSVGTGNTSSMEVMLGFTGNWIKAYKDSSEAGRKVLDDQYKAPTIEMEQFIRGGEVTVPVCVEEIKCLHPVPTKKIISGFAKYVRLMLIGTTDTSRDGILDRLVSTTDGLSATQQQFIEFAPGSVMAQLRALASNPTSARAYALYMVDYISAELAAHYVSEIISAVRFAAAQNTTDLSVSQWMKSLDQRHALLEAQVTNMSGRLKTIEASMTIAQAMRNNLNQRALKQTNVMPTITKININ